MLQLQGNHLKYRPFVDGLRAVAILPVVFFHAGLGFTGGYVGVDVFFVISGYLISGIILKELEKNEFHITEFWERRVRRILPALSVVVMACFVAGWFLFSPVDFQDLGQSMLAQAVLIANYFFYKDANYFAQGVDMKPLLHTWSLAVEEQFYLLFPFVLIAFRRLSKRSFLHAIELMWIASFILSVYCSYKHQRMNFYLLPSRSWELLTGSFLAAISAKQVLPRWLSESASMGGFLAILAAIFCYNDKTRFPGATALLPCIGSGLIIWANDNTLTTVGKFLSSRVMVFVGLISYSLYLWHWPILVFYKYAMPGPLPFAAKIILVIASFALAILSWKFVETPFRKRVIFKKRSQVFMFGGAATAAALALGFIAFHFQGVPSRIPAKALAYLNDPARDKNTNTPADRELSLSDVVNGNLDELGKGDTNQPVDLLVWGDSHAKVLVPVLDSLCKDHSQRGVLATHPQTAPLIGYDSEGEWSLKSDSIAYNKAVVDFVASRHVKNVLIVARWDYYIDIEKGTKKLHDDLLNTIDALEKSGAKVWILRQVPKYPWDVPKTLAIATMRGHDPEALGMTTEEYRAQSGMQDPVFDGVGAKNSRVTILDPAESFATGQGRCRVAKDSRAIYYDSDHVNVAGAMMLRPLFEPIFADKGRVLVKGDKE